MSAKGRISGKSGLVKHKDSWKDSMDGWAGEQATQFVHSHMYVLVPVRDKVGRKLNILAARRV